MLIGVDLGGTKTELLVIDDGVECFRHRLPTPSHNYALILQTIAQLFQQALSELNLSDIKKIGLAMPGALTAQGLVKNSNTVVLNGRPFVQDLEELLKLQVMVMNDANCFALSEATDGAAKNAATVFGVILGTGVGGGLVVNGNALIGANSIAGEWGHNPMPPSPRTSANTRACYCGKQNCIETFLSGRGFMQSYAELGGTAKQQTVEQLFKLPSASTDTLLEKMLDIYSEQLAASLALVINIVDPGYIVLGGGLSNIDALYSKVAAFLPRYVFSDSVKTKVVKNKYGDSSGVRGAAWLSQ
jgi:fructokinase